MCRHLGLRLSMCGRVGCVGSYARSGGRASCCARVCQSSLLRFTMLLGERIAGPGGAAHCCAGLDNRRGMRYISFGLFCKAIPRRFERFGPMAPGASGNQLLTESIASAKSVPATLVWGTPSNLFWSKVMADSMCSS